MAISSDLALFDTNILVYAMNEDAEQHEAAMNLRDRALAGKIAARLAPQVLFEYVAVTTRGRVMTTPLSASDALEDVEEFVAAFPIIHPPADIISRTLALARPLGITGVAIHDIHLVATMLANGITRIYTFDDAVFAKIKTIEPQFTVIEPT